MNIPTRWLLGTVLAVVACATQPNLWSQQPAPVPAPANVPPTQAVSPRAAKLSRLSLQERQFYLSAQRGAEWLQRANRPDGRFVYGYIPALRTPLEGDDYQRQVVAAAALARAVRYFGDDKAAAIAQQALLTLLLDATADAKSGVRHTTFPSSLVPRLSSAGLLVVAIHELPKPKGDLLEQADQLANYLRRRQRADGSLLGDDDVKVGPPDSGAQHVHAGLALCGLVRSGKKVPAAVPSDLIKKANAYYLGSWRQKKQPAPIPWHTAACAEAYLATRDQALAEAVFEMNDWLCGLQYQQPDPRRPLCVGGFKPWQDGQAVEQAPSIASAAYAHSLVHACRVARHAADATRFQRYRVALERCLQFLLTLQYTDANSQHFSDWYREKVVGAFHPTHQDGDLRVDYTAEPVWAMLEYLELAAEQ